jgi:ABC-type uncharacterized transport system permease subunit
MEHPLFKAHVIVLTLGLLLFCAAALASLLYLLEHRKLKSKKFGRIFFWLPSLDVLDRWTIRALMAGFVFLTLGMLTGLYLAHLEWHGDWLQKPKFIFSLAVWLWYVVLFFVRKQAGLRGGRFFAFIAIGFVLLATTFGGVMYFKPMG